MKSDANFHFAPLCLKLTTCNAGIFFLMHRIGNYNAKYSLDGLLRSTNTSFLFPQDKATWFQLAQN